MAEGADRLQPGLLEFCSCSFLIFLQGGEGQDAGGRHHGEVAGAVQHAGDHGKGGGEDAVRHSGLPGKSSFSLLEASPPGM